MSRLWRSLTLSTFFFVSTKSPVLCLPSTCSYQHSILTISERELNSIFLTWRAGEHRAPTPTDPTAFSLI